MAIEAGVDVLMVSDKYFKFFADHILAQYDENPGLKEKVQVACRKVVEFKIRHGLLEYSVDQNGNGVVSMPQSFGIYIGEELDRFNQLRDEGNLLVNFYGKATAW